VNLSDILYQLAGGLTTAGLLFLVSVGLTLVFGAMRVINFAHGSFYMYGAFIAAAIAAAIGTHSYGFWLGLVIAPVCVAALGAVAEIGVLRRVYGKEHLLQLLATYAMLLMLADISRRTWGTSLRTIPAPAGLQGALVLSGRRIPEYNLFIVAIALAVAGLLWVMLFRSGLGRTIRAAVEDPEMVSALGINVPRLFTVVFVIGAGLAGLAGAVFAAHGSVGQGLDGTIIIEAFVVTVIGGLGSVIGALVGAVIIGVSQAFGLLVLPSFAQAFIYVALIVVLVIRPSGLFGTVDR